MIGFLLFVISVNAATLGDLKGKCTFSIAKWVNGTCLHFESNGAQSIDVAKGILENSDLCRDSWVNCGTTKITMPVICDCPKRIERKTF